MSKHWKYVFLFIMALIFGYILLYIESLIIYRELVPVTPKKTILGITSIFAIIFFAKFGLEEFRKQKIRNQPSWIYYTYYGVASAPIVSEILSALHLFYPMKAIEIGGVNTWGIRISILLLMKIIYDMYKPDLKIVVKNAEDFGYGTTGREGDRLEFKDSAKNIAFGIANANKNVSIYALNGGPGEGKSSFARMIIEHLEDESILGKDNLLYTYVSLTETNEEKDFSKLFSQRWAETLTERYPKINTFNSSRMLSSILRENGQGTLAQIIEHLDMADVPLQKTKIRKSEEESDKEKFVSKKVARLFGNIYEIKEKLWVIMIDEIERAIFKEIYRLIEIIERFKYEGEKEFPIKIVFILCVSRENLRIFTSNFEENDEQAFLIKNFIIEEPKHVDKQLFLPPFNYETKRKFIFERLKKWAKIYDYDIEELEKIISGNWQNTLEQFINDEKEALGYVIEILIYKSPRVMQRCTQELEHFDLAFRNRLGTQIQMKKFVRLGDLLAVSYARVQYAEIINLFRIKMDENFPAEQGRIFRKFVRSEENRNQDIKTILSNLIKNTLNWDINNLPDKEEILRLVGLISFSFIEEIKGKAHEKNMDSYVYTLSDPQNLRDYLHTLHSGDDNLYRRLNSTYQEHKASKELPKETEENGYLLEYSRYLGIIDSREENLLLDVLKELFERLDGKKIKIEPGNFEHTVYDQAMYEINFKILRIFQKHSVDEKPGFILQETFKIFKGVLTSPNITVGGKYILLRSFADYRRGSGASIHIEFYEVFKKIITLFGEKEVKELVKNTLRELHRRFIEKERDIYEEEENFFFVLFQSWSGKADDEVNMKELQEIASRTLEKHPEMIHSYWRRYPFSKEWNESDNNLMEKIKEEINGVDKLSHYELYMPIETLLKITNKVKIDDEDLNEKIKFWNGFMTNSINYNKYKELVKLTDDDSTLRVVLTEFINSTR